MRFDYKSDAPLDFDCVTFLPADRLRRHRDIYMGNEAASLAVYTDGFDCRPDARALYKLSLYSLPRYMRRYHQSIREEAGGYWCHKMFFSSISSRAVLSDTAKSALCKAFGSVEQFRYRFTCVAESNSRQGFLWLARDRGRRDVLKLIFTEANSLLPPQMQEILCLDLWEHAYCEAFGNDRAAYAGAFLTVADFSKLDDR